MIASDSRRGVILAILLLGAVRGSGARGDDPAVSLADLPAYRGALQPVSPTPTASPVTFRDLWTKPDLHQGHTVSVEGRVARLFRQPAVGVFPPLAEVWITSTAGEPTCLVFPTDRPDRAAPEPGDQVRFVGTFLRKITYSGADTNRIAPLVVGPEAPVVLGSRSSSGGSPFPAIFGVDPIGEWGVGIAASLGVGWFLLRRHLTRPRPVSSTVGPSPVFEDGDDPAAGVDHDDQ